MIAKRPVQRGYFERLENRLLVAVYQDAQGWTVVEPSIDSRMVYVSDATGNDVYDGLSPQTAKKTIAAGRALIRDGHPDHLLLRKGDTFTNQHIRGWFQSGRSAQEPILIGSYGQGAHRPRILSGDEHGFALATSRQTSFLVIAGLYFEPHTRSLQDAPVGIRLVNQGGSDYIIEDNYVTLYNSNCDLQVLSAGNLHERVQFRRNIITNAYHASNHAKGMYVESTVGLTIEENFFDHNGWSQTIAGADPTIFRHNIYLHGGNAGEKSRGLDDVTVRDNFLSRAAAQGLKFQPYRGSHTVENNLAVRNGKGLQLGGGRPHLSNDPTDHQGIALTANGNIVTEIADYGGARGLGVSFANIRAGTFHGNIVAHKLPSVTTTNATLTFADGSRVETAGHGIRNFSLEHNVLYNTRGRVDINRPSQDKGLGLPVLENIRFENNTLQEHEPAFRGHLLDTYSADTGVHHFANNDYYHAAAPRHAWFRIDGNTLSFSEWTDALEETNSSEHQRPFVDPTRNVTTYAATLGHDSYDEFIAHLLQQSKDNWRPAYTTAAINEYIRAGFASPATEPSASAATDPGRPSAAETRMPLATVETIDDALTLWSLESPSALWREALSTWPQGAPTGDSHLEPGVGDQQTLEGNLHE